MILNIRIYPDSILRKECQDVKTINGEERKIAQNMLETMYRNDGVGLAASQVGILKKIIVIDVGDGPLILFNPKIISKRGKILSEEGCLSIPEVILKVKRSKIVEVEGLNEKNENFKIKADGYLSYALQHEIDHLNGVLILDRVGFWGRITQRNIFKKIK